MGVCNNPYISLTELARQDIAAGVIDGRVLQVLEILSQRFQVSVSVLKSGHSPYVSGTTTFSNHYFGRAADIYAANGVNVSSLNFHARQVALLLNQLPDQLHPSEVGTPFYDVVYPGALLTAITGITSTSASTRRFGLSGRAEPRASLLDSPMSR